MTKALRRSHFGFALALTVPAYLQTHESFRNFEVRLHAEGRQATLAFELESPEPMFLELELVVRATDEESPRVGLRVNETEIASLTADTLFLTQREKLFVAGKILRSGRNELTVETLGAASTTFELNARLHNYYGINPKFPRAFVVSDEAASLFFSAFSPIGRVFRFALFYLSSFFVVWGATRFLGQSPLVMGLPSVLLWGALLYGLVTPFHVFLSLEALLITGIVPLAVFSLARWVGTRRVVLARVGGVALVTLGLLEVAFRLYNEVRPSFLFYSDSYDRYRGRPGAPFFDSQLNSRGFNDLEPELDKNPNRFRIVAIGDSFALGVVPYPSNYLTLVEDALTDRGVDVINMGIPATNPDDYLALLVNEGLSFEPDLVMVGFFVGNDFESRARNPHEYSYVATFFRFLWRLSRPGRVAEHPGDTPDRYHDQQPSLDRNRFLAIEADRAEIYRKDGSIEDVLGRAVEALAKMRDIARGADSDFVVVLIPDELQVDPELQAEVARAYRSTPDAFDFTLPNHRLATRLTEEGIVFLDLLPVFTEESPPPRLYKPQDTHWNLAGNRLAADAIARFLTERF